MASKVAAWAGETLAKHWFYLLVQIIGIAFALRWIPDSNLPAPGFAVAGIGVLAAIMSVHPDMRPWQKCIWLILMGAFLATEIRAIRKDRIAQDAVFNGIRDKQDADFKATATSFVATIGGIQSTLQTVDRLLTSLESATWNFDFDLDCESAMNKNECVTLWKSSSNHPLVDYPLLETWPKHIEGQEGDPRYWYLAFFRDPKRADAYLDYLNSSGNAAENEPEPDLSFNVEANSATNPILRVSRDHRITVRIKKYSPHLFSEENTKIMSLDELPGSTLVITGLSPRTPAPTHIYVYLKNGKSLTIDSRGSLQAIQLGSQRELAFRFSIPQRQ